MESMIETGVLGDAGKQEHQILNTGVGFSGRQSEFTCNASGSRKRAREDSMALPSLHNPALSPLIPIPGVLLQSRSLESGATSTSGRHVPSSQAVSPSVRDLVSLLLQQNLEIDALVRVQTKDKAATFICHLRIPAASEYLNKHLLCIHLFLEMDVDGEAHIRIEKGGCLEMSSISLSPSFLGGWGSDFRRMLFGFLR
ncbi:hypothetical protein C4D60_Mb06t12420 [Musa balbisiana]|uniref:Uncharacterized protein n=1 Tax=Musa balbisiana TaxID=52838 RepID=A0A4S8IMI4_MUSBA|nr:hypothetical protein C4D60_Mb06t12420 [Musa balbisiana]